MTRDNLIGILHNYKQGLVSFEDMILAIDEYSSAATEGKSIVSGWQEVANIKKLKRGDIVRNKKSQNSYVVSANYGDRVTAICSVDITNAQEWEVLNHGQ